MEMAAKLARQSIRTKSGALLSGMVLRPKSTFFGKVNGCRTKKRKKKKKDTLEHNVQVAHAKGRHENQQGLNLCHRNPENMCPKNARGKKFSRFPFLCF